MSLLLNNWYMQYVDSNFSKIKMRVYWLKTYNHIYSIQFYVVILTEFHRSTQLTSLDDNVKSTVYYLTSPDFSGKSKGK